MSLHIHIVTPQRQVFEQEADSITLPGAEGELTVLSHHVPLFTPLNEGVVEVKSGSDEHFFAIGGGYFETDGKKAMILVSRAAGQDDIDENAVKDAKEKAQKMVSEAKTDEERHAAMQQLRRTLLDDKLLQMVRKNRH